MRTVPCMAGCDGPIWISITSSVESVTSAFVLQRAGSAMCSLGVGCGWCGRAQREGRSGFRIGSVSGSIGWRRLTG